MAFIPRPPSISFSTTGNVPEAHLNLSRIQKCTLQGRFCLNQGKFTVNLRDARPFEVRGLMNGLGVSHGTPVNTAFHAPSLYLIHMTPLLIRTPCYTLKHFCLDKYSLSASQLTNTTWTHNSCTFDNDQNLIVVEVMALGPTWSESY